MKIPTKEVVKPGKKSKVKQNNKLSMSPSSTMSTSQSLVGVKHQKKRDVDKGEQMDLTQLSAYAVYHNLVPGVKAYQDTSESTQASKRRKSSKKKALALKQEQANGSICENTNGAAAVPKQGNNKKVKVPLDVSFNANTSKSNKRITPTTVSASSSPVKTKKALSVQTSQQKRKQVPESTPMEMNQPTTKKQKQNNKKTKSHDDQESEAIVIGKKSAVTAHNPSPKVRKADKGLLLNPLFSNGDEEMFQPQTKNKKKKKAAVVVGSQNNGNVTISKSAAGKKQKQTNGTEPSKESTNSVSLSNPPNINSLLSSRVISDSVEYGKELFAWLIYPQTVDGFRKRYWEKEALFVKREEVKDFDWILSSTTLDDMLRKNVLKYSRNVNVVYYEKGERVTVSEDMTHRVRPAALWDYYQTGNSIQLLNPQTYCSPLRRLNAALQEMFGTFVGANVYLTPPDAQGFAPHYDDIEAFVLQIEGKKHWKLYNPRNPNEVLPRHSSKDFGKEESTLGDPFMDIILEPGDLLYFPRGIIHQAKTVDGCHSMHITISCYQQNSWADLLKQHFSKAVDKLAATDVELRKGLPMDYLSFMGVAPSKKKDSKNVANRKAFKSTLKSLITKVATVEADDAADEMGKKFIWDSLPPYLTRKEKDVTAVEDGEFLNNGIVKNRIEIDPDVKMKLVRKHCVRLVSEENSLRLYYSVENPLVYHEDEPQFVEISEEFQPAIEYLINSYPEFVKIDDLPMVDNDITKKIQIACDLWERTILMSDKPLEASEIDEDFDLDAASIDSDDMESMDGDDVIGMFGTEDNDNSDEEMDMPESNEDSDSDDFEVDSEDDD